MNILIQKSAYGLLAVALLFTLAFSFSQPAQAQSTSSQQAQIKTLLALIAQLQAQLAAMQGGAQVDNQCIQLTRNMYLGMRDSDAGGEVSQLQRYLTDTGYYKYGEITGFYGPVTQEAVQKLQNDRDIIETTGFGTVGSRTRTIVAETCEFATVDQTSVKSRSNSFELTGTADEDIEAVFVALIKPYTSNISSGDTSWRTLYKTGRYVAFTGDVVTRVDDGEWEVEFEGIPDGEYMVHVYENGTTDKHGLLIDQKLLAKHQLDVSAPDVVEYEPDDGDEFTIGVGQHADDGGFAVWVNDVFLSNGLSGTPRVSIITQSGDLRKVSHSLGLGDSTGTYVDEESKSDKIELIVEDISTSMNTVTFEINIPKPSGLGT